MCLACAGSIRRRTVSSNELRHRVCIGLVLRYPLELQPDDSKRVDQLTTVKALYDEDGDPSTCFCLAYGTRLRLVHALAPNQHLLNRGLTGHLCANTLLEFVSDSEGLEGVRVIDGNDAGVCIPLQLLREGEEFLLQIGDN